MNEQIGHYEKNHFIMQLLNKSNKKIPPTYICVWDFRIKSKNNWLIRSKYVEWIDINFIALIAFMEKKKNYKNQILYMQEIRQEKNWNLQEI